MSEVTIRYWAAAKDAAGVPEETVAAATLGEALTVAVANRASDAPLRNVLKRSSFLVNGTRVRAEETPLEDGAVIEILPPFAGG